MVPRRMPVAASSLAAVNGWSVVAPVVLAEVLEVVIDGVDDRTRLFNRVRLRSVNGFSLIIMSGF